MKLARLKKSSDNINRFVFWCPGCDSAHQIDNTWGFNDDLNHPTFSPSYLTKWREGKNREQRKCHSFITDGNIRFLGDCTHELAGQTVEIPEWDRQDWGGLDTASDKDS